MISGELADEMHSLLPTAALRRSGSLVAHGNTACQTPSHIVIVVQRPIDRRLAARRRSTAFDLICLLRAMSGSVSPQRLDQRLGESTEHVGFLREAKTTTRSQAGRVPLLTSGGADDSRFCVRPCAPSAIGVRSCIRTLSPATRSV